VFPIPVYSFESTLKQRVLLILPAFYIYPGLLIGTYLLNVDIRSLGMTAVVILFSIIDTLPALIVFIQYWLKNRRSVLTIDTDKRNLLYETPAQQFAYSFDDISNLDYYRALGKGSGMHAFGEFRYYRLTFKDKTEIIVTCIMIGHIEYIFESLLGIKAERHAELVCFL
jgi:hypothetical protein